MSSHTLRRNLGCLTAALSVVLTAACGGTGPDTGYGALMPSADCDATTILAPGMAPCNPWLATTAQTATHGNSYRQSDYLAATSATGALRADHLRLGGAVSIWAHVSPRYPDGSQVLWLNVAGSDQVVKVDRESFTVLAQTAPSAPRQGMGVAYNELNANNQLIRLEGSVLEAWGDQDPADPRSPIIRIASYPVPPSATCEGENLVGLAHTYDGNVVIGTSLGNILVLPADPALWDGDPLATHSINGSRCGNGAGRDDPGKELMSNTIAVDEKGGVYAVSDKALYRLQWDGSRLTPVWRSPYVAQTLGAFTGGSGSTPTLMGDPDQADRFVVITDASRTMRLNVYWRDEIPPGWVPPVGDDPRLACSIPVDFGEPGRTGTKTDQSVVVDGYGAYVVDNTVRHLPGLEQVGAGARNVFTSLAGGVQKHSPRGAERIDWDPATRTCRVAWTNPDVHFPNGIPMLSRGSNLMLGNSVEFRNGTATWGVVALDADTGTRVWFVPGSHPACDGAMDSLSSLLNLDAPDAPYHPDTSQACENGNYSGMTMDDDGVIYTGTQYGVSRFVPVDGSAS